MTHFSKQTIHNYVGWDEFYAQDIDEKLSSFSKEGRLFDIIFSQQFDRSFLVAMCILANN